MPEAKARRWKQEGAKPGTSAGSGEAGITQEQGQWGWGPRRRVWTRVNRIKSPSAGDWTPRGPRVTWQRLAYLEINAEQKELGLRISWSMPPIFGTTSAACRWFQLPHSLRVLGMGQERERYDFKTGTQNVNLGPGQKFLPKQ